MLQTALLHAAGGGPGLRVLLAATSAGSSATHVTLVSVFIRLLFSLALVLAVIWVLAQYVKRRGVPGSNRGSVGRAKAAGPAIEVLARQPLGKGIALVAVRTGSTALLLGVTAQQVTTLGELDPADLGAPAEETGRPAERTTILGLREQATTAFAERTFSPSTFRPIRVPRPAASGASRLEQLREITTRRS